MAVMSDPGEVISAIFSTAVLLVVLAVLVGAFRGWNVSGIVNVVSSLAVPFLIGLIFLFLLLTVVQSA